MTNGLIVSPPYLEFGKPSDQPLIEEALEALWMRALQSRPRSEWPLWLRQLLAGSNSRAVAQIDASEKEQIRNAIKAAAEALAKERPSLAGSAHPSTSRAMRSRNVAQPVEEKVSSSPVSVVPGGMVPIGFNCTKTFDAELLYPPPNAVYFVWTLYMQNKVSWTFDQIFFLGGDVYKKTTMWKVKFDHDFSSYKNAAYTSPANFALFIVGCKAYDWSGEIGTYYSDPITLDFSPQSCIGIHSLGLSTNSVTGGNHGSEPTLTVALDAPAGPGGQTVHLGSSNPSLGWVLSSASSLTIPAGQVSGTISGFLNTKKVLVTGKSFHVIAQLVSPSGNSGPAYAQIWVTKQ